MVLLAAVLLLLRWPTINHPWPVHPDEAEFVSALGFNRPYPVHHPGYPLWVALGTALTPFFSGYRAFQVWCLLASVGGPVLLFAWLRRYIDGPTSWWAALAFGVNPLVWFHAATALNYGPALLAALVIAWLVWRARPRPRPGMLAAAAVILAIALGLRADLLLWVGPLLVWAAYRSSPRTLPGTVAILLLGVLGWAAISTRLYQGGGPSLSHTIEVVRSTSIVERGLTDGLIRNAAKLAAYLGWTSWPLALLATCGSARRMKGAGDTGADRPAGRGVLWVWVAPALAFHLLVHVTEVGHVLGYLPAAYVAVALRTSTAWPARRTRLAWALVAMASIAQFTAYPWRSDATGWQRVLNAKVAFVSLSGLRQIDARNRLQQPGDIWPITGQ